MATARTVRSTSSTDPAGSSDGGAAARRRLRATVGGAAIAALAHLLAVAAGVDMLVPDFGGEGTQQLATIGVAASAAVAALVGWVVAWLATRFTGRPRTSWLAFAIVGLLVSFVPVFAIEAAVATQVVLAVQHLLVAAVVIPVFASTLPRSA